MQPVVARPAHAQQVCRVVGDLQPSLTLIVHEGVDVVDILGTDNTAKTLAHLAQRMLHHVRLAEPTPQAGAINVDTLTAVGGSIPGSLLRFR